MRVEHELRLAHLAPLLEVAAQLFSSVHRCSRLHAIEDRVGDVGLGHQRQTLFVAVAHEQA